ncbi:MAG: hypothetical protein ACLQK4_17165 [Acidimicrobiales bacterium]
MPAIKRPSSSNRPANPSLKPALFVVALAVVIVVGGAALSLAGTSSARPAASNGPVKSVPGSRLRAQSASSLIARIASGGEPPQDVTNALAVPAGSRYLGKADLDKGLSQFNRDVKISVDAPEAEVETFYMKLLAQRRWVSDSISTPKKGSTEILAQRGGSDGYQWGVGLLLTGVGVGVVSSALAGGGASAARTTVTITLYQVEDAS